MERQLANLTGLVQKALVSQNPVTPVESLSLDPKFSSIQSKIQSNYYFINY